MSYSVEHILFMQLKDDLSEQDLKELNDKIEEMRSIPGVVTISFGKNFASKERAGVCNYGYRVLLRDEADLDVYQPHKLHQEFRDILNRVRVGLPVLVLFQSIFGMIFLKVSNYMATVVRRKKTWKENSRGKHTFINQIVFRQC
eukprot:gene7640-9398_t